MKLKPKYVIDDDWRFVDNRKKTLRKWLNRIRREIRSLPDLCFQYFLYRNHAPIANTMMHAMVPKIEPATAPPQLTSSDDADDIVESAIFIISFCRFKIHLLFENEMRKESEG